MTIQEHIENNNQQFRTILGTMVNRALNGQKPFKPLTEQDDKVEKAAAVARQLSPTFDTDYETVVRKAVQQELENISP